MKQWIVFSVLFLSALSSQALTTEYFKKGKLLRAANLYQEGASWRLEIFDVEPGELQEKNLSELFTTEASAKKVLKSHSRSFVSLSPQEWEERMGSPDFQAQTEVQGQVLWRAKYEWNQQWEERYYQWVEDNFTADFFVEYGIKTDCADVAIMLHWIFARIHSLPAANTLAGTRKLITHESMKSSWLNYPTGKEWNKDKRFLQVLNYLADNTYTHSLGPDSYPVRISRETLRPGILHLVLFGSSGHTRLIAETNYEDPKQVPMLVYSSTVPREVRPLMVELPATLRGPSNEGEGFRAIRWPIQINGSWRLMKAEAHPSYGQDQFHPPFGEGSDFGKQVLDSLVPNLDWTAIAMGMMNDIHQQFLARVSVVEEGYQACQKTDCSKGTAAYEAWSTPSRDKRIRENIWFTESLLYSLAIDDPEISDLWADFAQSTQIELFGNQIELSYLVQNWLQSFYVSDPKASPHVRWLVSREGIFEYIQNELPKLLQSRAARIENGSCLATEPFQGKCVQKGQSLSEDDQWRVLASLRNQYCKLQGDEACRELQGLLASVSLQVSNTNQNLNEWLALSYLSSWDPRDSADLRWGRQKVQSTIFGPADSILSFGDGAILSDGAELYFQKLQFQRKKMSCSGVLVSPDRKSALCLRDQKVYFIKLVEGLPEYFVHEFQNVSDIVGVAWHSPMHFSMATSDQIFVFAHLQNELLLTDDFAGGASFDLWDFEERPLQFAESFTDVFLVDHHFQRYLARVNEVGSVQISTAPISIDATELLDWQGDRALLLTNEELHLWSVSGAESLEVVPADFGIHFKIPGSSLAVGTAFGMSSTLIGWDDQLNLQLHSAQEGDVFLGAVGRNSSNSVVSLQGEGKTHISWDGRAFTKLEDPRDFFRVAVMADVQLMLTKSEGDLGLYGLENNRLLLRLGTSGGMGDFCVAQDYFKPSYLAGENCITAEGIGVSDFMAYPADTYYFTNSVHWIKDNELALKVYSQLRHQERTSSELARSDGYVDAKTRDGILIPLGDRFWLQIQE